MIGQCRHIVSLIGSTQLSQLTWAGCLRNSDCWNRNRGWNEVCCHRPNNGNHKLPVGHLWAVENAWWCFANGNSCQSKVVWPECRSNPVHQQTDRSWSPANSSCPICRHCHRSHVCVWVNTKQNAKDVNRLFAPLTVLSLFLANRQQVVMVHYYYMCVCVCVCVCVCTMTIITNWWIFIAACLHCIHSITVVHTHTHRHLFRWRCTREVSMCSNWLSVKADRGVIIGGTRAVRNKPLGTQKWTSNGQCPLIECQWTLCQCASERRNRPN